MKKFIRFILLIIAVALVACEPEEIPFRPQADVFMIVKAIDNNNGLDTIYGLALHVFANKPMTNVSASPDNDTDVAYLLEPYNQYPYDYYYQTPNENLSQEQPFIGTYTFNILAETTETKTLSDNLIEDEIIYPTDTIKYTYDTDKKQTDISWNKIKHASYLMVKLYKNDTIRFQREATGTATKISISESGNGWISGFKPTSGDNFIMELNGYMYEPGATNGVNLQAKSINLKTIVWAQ